MNLKIKLLLISLLFFIGFGAMIFAAKTSPTFGEIGGSVRNVNGILKIKSSGTSFINKGFDIDTKDWADTPLKGMLLAIGGESGEITEEQVRGIAVAIIVAAFPKGQINPATGEVEYPGLTGSEIVSALNTYLATNYEGYDPAKMKDVFIKYKNTDPIAMIDQSNQILDKIKSAKNNAAASPDQLTATNGGLSEERRQTLEDQGLLDCVAGVGAKTGGLSSSNTGNGTNGGGNGGTITTPRKVSPTVANETAAAQTSKMPVIKVNTNLPADCEYKKDSSFTYGAGTKFDTTGSYAHNAQFNNFTSGDYVFYAACEDKETKGVSDAIKITFKVDLSLDPNNAPKVTSATSAIQADAGPKLAAVTDRRAECQYKKDADFAYGSGTAMTAEDDSHKHSAALASLADGDYVFYVVCRDIATKAPAPGLKINTKLDRVVIDNSPVITNTTDAYQNTASVNISITTTRDAACRYKKGSTFAYDDTTATQFAADGTKIHSAPLTGLADGDYIYYAVCKDAASGAKNSAGREIRFTVSGAVPVISSTTPAIQTGTEPKLSVTTSRAAACQYKKDASFTYDNGTAMAAAAGNQSHSIPLASFADGSYVFYVACKDNISSAAAGAIKIDTRIDRSGNDSNAPVLTNTTSGYQATGNPIISVTTDKDSECQYKTSLFIYGNGTRFANDGTTIHSAELSNISNGQHGYYVVCKRISNNVASATGYQIIFTVNSTGDAGVCAALSSNDRQNDNSRSNSGNTAANSVFLWQAVETGTRESFKKVSWHAGYQFSTQKNGQATQLCGYFESGITNRVSLYNGSYSELASAQITGNGSWKCANISPTTVTRDSRYYVIARAQGTPIFYEYKSGMLPKDANNAVVEAGIRQSGENNFGNNIKKYDYMVFGLVDVKIRYGANNDSGPAITYSGPTGTVNNASVKLAAATDVDSICKFDRDDVSYESMKYVLPKAAANNYEKLVCGLDNGAFTFFARCKKTADGAENNGSAVIQFNVSR